MTQEGEQLTQEGEFLDGNFSIHRKVSLTFSESTSNEDAVNLASRDRKHKSLKMIFVLKGVLKGFDGATPKKTFFLPERHHNLVLADNDIIWQSLEQDSDIICLDIDFGFLNKYLPKDHSGLVNLKKGSESTKIAAFSSQHLYISPEILTILSSLKTSTHEGFCERLFMESKVLELLMFQVSQFEQINTMQSSIQLKQADMDKMLEVKAILENNLDVQLSLRELAHMVGTNEFNLKRNFKIAFGTTVFGYLNQYKMEMAKTMLLENDVNIADIASKMGYKYATHFSSAFKKHFGYLPNKLKAGTLCVLVGIAECSEILKTSLLA